MDFPSPSHIILEEVVLQTLWPGQQIPRFRPARQPKEEEELWQLPMTKKKQIDTHRETRLSFLSGIC